MRWGLGNDLRRASVKPESITFRRCKHFLSFSLQNSEARLDNTGHRVGWTKWGENMDRDYGAPYCHVHVSPFNFLSSKSSQ